VQLENSVVVINITVIKASYLSQVVFLLIITSRLSKTTTTIKIIEQYTFTISKKKAMQAANDIVIAGLCLMELNSTAAVILLSVTIFLACIVETGSFRSL